MNSIILNQSENPIKILHNFFSIHNGARVFICNAGVQASCESLCKFSCMVFSLPTLDSYWSQ
jgi:hypothetical protein